MKLQYKSDKLVVHNGMQRNFEPAGNPTSVEKVNQLIHSSNYASTRKPYQATRFPAEPLPFV
jgi:hypothetical protein